jgi:hypothetical protein
MPYRSPKKFTALLRTVLTAAAVVLAVVPSGCGGNPTAEVTGATSTGDAAGMDSYADQPRNPFGIYSPGNLDEVPVPSKTEMMSALGIDNYPAFQDRIIDQVRQLDLGWTRVDFWYLGTEFAAQPGYLEKLREAGMTVVGSTRLMDKFVPTDMATFEKSLRQLVQQYPWIKIWQVGNEPNVSLTYPEEYPRMFLAGSRVVREECPDCKVMLAGVAARYPTEVQAVDVYRRALGEIAALAGGGQPFDIFDVHFYAKAGSENAMLAEIASYRALLEEYGYGSAEIWLTETATWTGRITDPAIAPIQNEGEQASELVRRFVSLLDAGLTGVSWARPYENYRYSYGEVDGIYDNTALIYNGLGQETARGVPAGTPKQSFFAYKTLVAKVAGFSEVRKMAPGAYEFGFPEDGRRLYVLWDAGSNLIAANVLPGDSEQFVVCDMLGDGDVMEAEDIALGPKPIYVETV